MRYVGIDIRYIKKYLFYDACVFIILRQFSTDYRAAFRLYILPVPSESVSRNIALTIPAKVFEQQQNMVQIWIENISLVYSNLS
jgi:hypothetical protein